MTANNNWPGKPGVPMNPERDDWHFLRMNNGTLKATLWRADGYWLNPPGYDGLTSPKTTAYWNTYIGPCLTPDEAEGLRARIAELEAALAALQRDASQEIATDEMVRRLQHLGDWQAADRIEALQKRAALLISIIKRSFCYDGEEDLLRLLARSLCRVEGQDPDAIISVDKGPFDKNWKRFLPQARAALEGGKDE